MCVPFAGYGLYKRNVIEMSRGMILAFFLKCDGLAVTVQVSAVHWLKLYKLAFSR